MPSKNPQFIIRCEEKEIFEKIKVIAKENNRSASAEIIYIIKEHIKDYEKEHGAISTEE